MPDSFGLGAFTLGGFPDADSLTITDPLPHLLADLSAKREFLLRATPAAPAGIALYPGIGNTARIDYGNVFDHTAADSFSVELLMSFLSGGAVLVAASKGDTMGGSDAGWALFYDSGSHSLGTQFGDGVIAAHLSYSAPADNAVHRVTFVVDRARQLHLLYLDGGLVASTSIASIGSPSNAFHLYVGAVTGGTTSKPHNVSDFRALPFALTAAQISSAAFRRLTPTEAATAYIYSRLDDGSGTTASDSSGNNRTGTLSTPNGGWLPTIGTVIVDFSSSGYVSHASDTPPSKLFIGCLAKPYSLSVNLPIPALSGGATLGIGNPVINNGDALRDAEALNDWLGASSDIYIGRKSDPLSLFTRIFRGTAAGVTESLDSWTVLHRDARFTLQHRLQRNRYGGFGAAIRFDGSNGYASGTWTCPAGDMTLEAIIRGTNYGVSRDVCGFGNNVAGARRIWMNGVYPSLAVANDAGTVFTASSTTALATGVRHLLSLSIDTVGLAAHLYVDGALVATQTLTGTFSTVLSTFAVGRIAPSALNYFAGDLDEVRVWSAARTQVDIQSTSSTTLYGGEPGLLHYYKFDEGSGSTAGDSVATGGVNLSITGTLGTQAIWVGSLEGDSSIAGKTKPLGFGLNRMVSPVCVDPQNLIYQVHDGGIHSVLSVKVAGVDLTFNADFSDPYSDTPVEANYDTCLARGLVRLGFDPGSNPITIDFEGDSDGSLGYRSTAAGIHHKILTQFGGKTDADLDLAAYSALDTLQPGTVGYYWPTDINIDKALDDVMAGVSCWWAPTRVATITVGRIDPPETLTPTNTIVKTDTTDPSQSGKFEPALVSVRVGTVIVGYRPYSTVLKAAEVAGEVSFTNRNDFGQNYRYTQPITAPGASASADTITVLTALDSYTDAVAEAKRILSLLKVDRKTYPFTLDAGVLSYFIGTVFRVTHPRYELPWGKNLVLVGLQEDMGDQGTGSGGTVDSLSVILYG